ncbi:hypothetical protein LXA43DRAFT_1089836 [Ganoderma leucocontextum]|nr:hypothetical protein LXA43DRAFT_1089836 [Ganoderma leucocontextum]
MAMNSKTAQPSPGTVNLARAFYEHIESLQTFARAGRINPRTMNVETLENLLQLTDNADHILRGLINGCRPVNQLPSEILATIFSFVPQPHYQATWLATFCSHKMVKAADLLPITSTCRHWREVAEATSWLWSTVVDTKPQDGQPPLYTHYLDRCPTGPLRFLIARPVSEPMLSVLAAQSSRASEIVVLAVNASDFTTIASTPLSALLCCHFSHCQSATPTVPLFPGGCPRLRTLSLESANFVPSTGFPSLTHLQMSYPTYFGGTRYTLRDFFAFLSGCPNLRTMFFEVPQVEFGVSELTPGNFRGPIVPLGHLERLVIIDHHCEPGMVHEWMAFLRTFYAHVSIPSSCVVRLGEVRLSDVSNCTDLFGFTENPTSWRIYKGENRAYAASRADIVSIQVFSPMDDRYLWLDIIKSPLGPSAMDDDVLELSTALAQSPVFANAREVWIDPGCAWVLSTGRDPLLSHMSQLESLVICRPTQESPSIRDSKIFQALETTEGATPEDLACPQLATLRVDCLTDEDAVYVLQLAASRAAAGRPFPRITLGRTFRGRTAVCMLHQYDGGGEVIKVGDMRSDALWDHWMSQLSPICLDESEDCEPYWRSWRWESLQK